MSTPTISGWQLLWRENPGVAHLLGLCPLLAVTTTAVHGMALALATASVLVLANGAVAIVRGAIPTALRLPTMVLVIAVSTTAVMLLMQAFLFDMYLRIALFVQIIVTNCIILARADQVARQSGVVGALVDGLAAGIGFGSVLILVGALRELIGFGTLGDGLELLFGPAAAGMQLNLTADGEAFLLATLPPGGFLILGVLAALHARSIRGPG